MPGRGQLLALLCCVVVAVGKKALIIVDTQECFLENGTLPVQASQIIPKINQIRDEMDCLFDLVVLSQDYHPAGHISFGTAHGMPAEVANDAGTNSWRGNIPMKCVKLENLTDPSEASCCPDYYLDGDTSTYTASAGITSGNLACSTCASSPDQCFNTSMDLWLDHCIAGSDDAKLSTSMVTKATDEVVQKGTLTHVEMFSAFFDNTQTYSSNLHATLQAHGITDVMVAGIATTHCVRWTAQDAHNLNYNTTVIMDASAGIWGVGSYVDEADAVSELQAYGIGTVNTADVLSMECQADVSSARVPAVLGPMILFLVVALAMALP